MLCSKCMRTLFAPLSSTSRLGRVNAALLRIQPPQRPLSILSRLPIRPTIANTSLPAKSEDVPTSSLQPLSAPVLPLSQVRGAKRNTFNPSHRVRKRRHGYLARLKSRTGRKILKRRAAKGRHTLSH